jgi:Uma2 family endonuclease
MSMSTGALKRYTVEEYLARERVAESKSEFFDGELFAMAGGSKSHNVICFNLIRRLGNALDRKPCQGFPSDMRVVTPTGLYTYPDASVACGPAEFQDDREDVLLNPVVLFEVLSPSTESYDRGRKFQNYQSIPSLKEYILISQDRPLVEHFTRQAETNTWLLESYTEGEFPLPSLGVSLTVNDLYENVEFS